MPDLPDGYEQRRTDEMTYVCRAGEHETIREMGLSSLKGIQALLASGNPGGRGRISEVPPPEDLPGQTLILKQVVHGGLYARLNRERFLGPRRLLRQLRLVHKARERGVPTPDIGYMAWSHGRPCRLYLATERVPASRSLEELLQDEGAGRQRGLALVAAADAVREMHDAGLVHGDLNLGNLMVAQTERAPEGFVIDLDYSWFPPEITEAHRAANLARLLRSVEKSGALAHRAALRERLGFLRNYCRGMGPLYRRLSRRLRRRVALFRLHRMAWRVGWR